MYFLLTVERRGHNYQISKSWPIFQHSDAILSCHLCETSLFREKKKKGKVAFLVIHRLANPTPNISTHSKTGVVRPRWVLTVRGERRAESKSRTESSQDLPS